MIKFGFLLVLVLFLAQTPFSFRVEPRAGCSISVSNLNPEPIVASDKTYQFLYAEPDASSISIKVGETILISCPGGQLSIGSIQASSIEATCTSGTQFTASGKTIDFNQITCSRTPFHTARYTGKSCEANGKEIEIGFILAENSFAREILICFDQKNLNSLYSTYNLTRSIGNHDTGVARPTFIEDDFYNLKVKVNDLYVRDGQKATINGLLGLSATSTKYIADSSDFYLARGHLTAKADFVYAPQQTATFHYVNVAPQWQTFNGDNWETVEADVRDHAEANGWDLKVYTGTYGVTTLPHEKSGEDVPLYLYIGDNGEKGIPVPELYWKVAYNPKTKQGVALIGINNPYQTDMKKSVICNDVSSSLKWLDWKATNLKSGYSYACTVDDLRKSVTYLPAFEVTGLLL